ncbi:MAG: hypothetical protein IPK93_02135 [Solirubrobacterales bacterium]|nr:hypothetical protein [Solirubrobacterales bacterium]
MKLGETQTSRHFRRSLLALPLALLGMLAFASAAQAAFGLGGLVAAPANTDSGAKSDFHVHLDVTTPGDQLRDLTVSLPPGLSGNPQSVPKCPAASLNADACPAGSQIGSTTVQLTAMSVVPLTVEGSVYNVVPEPGEPARLGIVLRPPDPSHLVLPPIIMQVEVGLRPDFGLDTILADLPKNAEILGAIPVGIAINSVDLNLDGSFMRNPTSCGTQTTAFSARSWAMGEGDPAATGTTTYVSTNCKKQAYEPNASLDINGDGQELIKDSRPTVSAVITQTEAEANNERAAVLLPAAIGIVVSQLGETCRPLDFQAGKCPANAQVGNATAVSPLLDSDLTGAVYLVAANGFPQIGVDLKGALPLKILGSTGLRDGRIENIFEGLPDLPLSRFALTFPGGSNGLLKVVDDVCADTSIFSVDFTSQAGKKLSRTLPTTETGCPAGGWNPGGDGVPGTGSQAKEPRAKVRVSGTKRHRPRVSIRIKSVNAGMGTVKVKLPRALKLNRRAQRRVVVKADGTRIRGKKNLFAKGRKLKVLGLPGTGANVLTVAIRPKAIKHPRKLRKSKKLAFNLKILRPDQEPVKLKVRSRARG